MAEEYTVVIERDEEEYYVTEVAGTGDEQRRYRCPVRRTRRVLGNRYRDRKRFVR
jgi:hypothetical protein